MFASGLYGLRGFRAMTYGTGGWVGENRLKSIFENWDELPDDDHPNRKVSKASILAAYS